MRRHALRRFVLVSLTILLGFSQYPARAQQPGDPASAAPSARPTVEERHRELREGGAGFLDLEPALTGLGHSHYRDLLRPSASPSEIVVVVDLGSQLLEDREWIRRLPPSVAVLVSAPRRDSRDAARIAGALDATASTAPRIYLSAGPRSEWSLAVPGAVAPLWLTSSIMAASPLPVRRADLNAARLGFGREDPLLSTALASDQAAARLRVRSSEEIGVALTALPGQLRALDGAQRRDARNYLVVPLQRDLIIPEAVLVWSIVVITGLVLGYAVARPRRIYRYVRAIGHNLGATVGLFAVLVVSQIVANLVIRLILRVPLIEPDPLALAAGKLSIGVLVLALLYPLLHIRLRRASAVYSGTSLFLMIVGALVAGSSSIILGAFFVVTFVCGFIFSLVRPAALKSLALLAALAPGAYLLLALASVADARMAAELLTPAILRELVTAVIFLPLLLMFFRLEAITPRIPLLPSMVMISLITLALVAATILNGVGDPPPVAVRGEERVAAEAGATRVELRALDPGLPAISGRALRLRAPGGRQLICDALPCRETLAARPSPFNLRLEQEQALDRSGIDLFVGFAEPAEELTLIIESSLPVQLYASDLPMEQAVGTTGSRFVSALGPMPPASVSGTFVLRRDPAGPEGLISVQITARASFNRLEEAELSVAEGSGILTAGGVELVEYREMQVTTRSVTLES